jgi:hypothetical protein
VFPHLPLVQLAHELLLLKEALGLGRQQELELELELELEPGLEQKLQLGSGLGLCLQVEVVGHDFVHELGLLGYTIVLVSDFVLVVQVVDAHRQLGE